MGAPAGPHLAPIVPIVLMNEPHPSRRGDPQDAPRVVVLLEHEDGYRTPLVLVLDGRPLPLMWGNSDVYLRYHQQHFESRIVAISIATLAAAAPNALPRPSNGHSTDDAEPTHP